MSWVVPTEYGLALMPGPPPPPGHSFEAKYWALAERRAGRPSHEAVLTGAAATADDWYEALAFLLAERSPA